MENSQTQIWNLTKSKQPMKTIFTIYIYIYFHHTTCENTCDTLPSSATNQSDITVSVAQGSIATPGATNQLLPPDRVLNIYIYIYIYEEESQHNFAVSADQRVEIKQSEKRGKYLNLASELTKLRNTSENSSVARESSRVIISKSRLKSKGHSACTSEVRDIFDRQTHILNDWWQLMCSHVLQPWDRRNSMTTPVRNITIWRQVESIQTTSVLRLARILKRVLETWGDFAVTQNPVTVFSASADVKKLP